MRSATGSGTQRLYGFRDILVLKVVKRLLDTGVSLQQIRDAIQQLRDRGVEDLAQITLMSDGASRLRVHVGRRGHRPLQGGQGVFGIAVGRVWREVEGELAQLPSERAEDEALGRPPRRRARAPAATPGSPDLPPQTVASPPLPRSGGPSCRLALADHPAWESPRRNSSGRRRGKLPGTSQAPGPRGTGTSEVALPP